MAVKCPIRCVLVVLLAAAVSFVSGGAIAGPAAGSQDAAPLVPRNVVLAKTSASGLAAGAFMAVQFHVAHSSEMAGVGLIAGGPYLCAAGNPLMAAACMQGNALWPHGQSLYEAALPLAMTGAIDPLDRLTEAQVYLFSGTADMVVNRKAVEETEAFYRAAHVPPNRIRMETGLEAGNGFIAPGGVNDCNANRSPYVNACGDYDQAGRILSHIYGGLNPPLENQGAGQPAASPFDQTPFGDPVRTGLAPAGYVYVPPACAGGAACAVHIVFHGCRQSAAEVGDAVTAGAGFNRWAANNNLIVLYPQLSPRRSADPIACWDWIGTTGADYATKGGAQIAAVHAMLTTLAGQR
ncbi:extracellular catalytic domain type 2 short-chain-length polyhydroxyalkanoate depolymerase [Azospirillum sp. B510]|uniref:extracellular catalytic domain type 2 short-chain-length polyhydroxyalkanoate depolymerase n=1 Tax=Azospirillum sp. (strain B510) TaxID=137722 RepID=UPI0011D09CD2|nr:PHB depolymerase family esterase [Azospirillum sp. B510]